MQGHQNRCYQGPGVSHTSILPIFHARCPAALEGRFVLSISGANSSRDSERGRISNGHQHMSRLIAASLIGAPNSRSTDYSTLPGINCSRNNLQRTLVRARVFATVAGATAAAANIEALEKHIDVLNAYATADDADKSATLGQAITAVSAIKETVSFIVNTKAPGLKSLQSSIVGSGAVAALIQVACRGEPIAYEALQILCYRNTIACDQIIAEGIVDTIAMDLSSSNVELQSAMCFLLTALAAFSEATHGTIVTSGLVPQLVSMCRPSKAGAAREAGDRYKQSQVENRSAAVLRNLAHNTKQHALLVQTGTVDSMLGIMKHATDPALRINAAVTVACLVGHEENNTRLQIDEELVQEMLEVLDASCQGIMCYGTFWTVWKLCQGLSNLAINDRNKGLICNHGGVGLLAEVLFGRHHNNEAAQRYALSAIWNLAFNDQSRKQIVEFSGLVDAIRNILNTTESPKTKEVAKGALWTLGLEKDVKSLMGSTAAASGLSDRDEILGQVEGYEHVMLSYEWGCQQSVLLIKSELQKAGYQTWMDVDRMSGSTLEAMAHAVEGSAVVLVCVSKKYKESQACRTEAEYAFQQRKKIVPVIMESGYKPSGWLGALMGTRLYFDMSDARRIPAKIPFLVKELGEDGRPPSATSTSDLAEKRSVGDFTTAKMGADNPDNWSVVEVEDWLKKVKCAEYTKPFREQDMDGMALSGLLRMSADSRLVHEVLEAEFGMRSLGQRLRMVEELHRLFS